MNLMIKLSQKMMSLLQMYYYTYSSISGPTKVSKSETSRRSPAITNGTPKAWIIAINKEGFDLRLLVVPSPWWSGSWVCAAVVNVCIGSYPDGPLEWNVVLSTHITSSLHHHHSLTLLCSVDVASCWPILELLFVRCH